MNAGLADLLTLTKLAWDLYHNCYLVARDAPDGFRQLVNELASLQGILRSLRDDVNSDKSFLERLGEDRKQTLERCLQGCFHTLQELRDLVMKYRQLGIGDGLMFWQKIKWITQKSTINELKSKVMVHSCNLSLCMSSIGNSSLTRIETSLKDALERQQTSQPTDSSESLEAEDVIKPLEKVTSNQTETADSDDPRVGGLRRRSTGISGMTLVGAGGRHISTCSDSTGSMHSDELSENGASPPGSPVPRKPLAPYKPAFQPQTLSGTHRKLSSTSPRASDNALPESKNDHHPEKPLEKPTQAINNHDFGTIEHGATLNVSEVVAEAMKELSQVRKREQSVRPLRIVEQDKVHRPNQFVKAKFEELAQDELRIRKLNSRDWLRVATWWLLKARKSISNYEKQPPLPSSNTRSSLSVSTESKSATAQAYVDLLKASYILYEIVLKNQNTEAPLLTDENRKLFYNLSDGISEDFAQFRPEDVPEPHLFEQLNLNIWELLQPGEESPEDDELFHTLENTRWITVEQEDAGEEDERVLFRTFVNAGIGGKRYRMKTKGAPYMLLLSTKEGESEPKVTILNQSGTLFLQRDFLPADLDQLLLVSNVGPSAINGPGMGEAIPLNFGRMNVSLTFLYDSDLSQFINIPKAYFDAVKRREPRESEDSSETLIFKSSVEVFEQLKASTMQPASPRQISYSCDLRVLERVYNERWRATRRMVVSSSAGERRPWSIEFFMPLSRVQINRDANPRLVLVKWSDTSQERSDKTDGNYNPLYSYVYDDTNPNICMSLHFRNQVDAGDFENAILYLNQKPLFSWSQTMSSGCVYDISDTEPHLKQYKGLHLTYKRLSWKYSEIFYLYRDMDYEYDNTHARVRFPQVHYTDYLSSHVNKLWKLNSPPPFAYCEKKVGHTVVEFDDADMIRSFMGALSAGHELLFSRRAHWITTKEKSRLIYSKSTKGNAEVQLWKKGNTMYLLSRWEDKVVDKWIAAQVPRSKGLNHARDSNRASIPKVEYSRGTTIDMANLIARNPRESHSGKKEGPINITFDTVRDREEFVSALEGTAPPTLRSPMDDLFGSLIQ